MVYEDAPLPELREGDALIRVRAAGITPTEFTWNSTFVTRDKRGRLPAIPGFEMAGIVDEAGPDSSGPAKGDAVYGLLDFWRDGSAAEYVAARASDLAPKPESAGFIQAAAVPLSGLTAWQALFDHAKISQGDRVLIHGAGGGVGTFALQMAKWKGAHVAATCSSSKADLVRELGADEVVDYTKARFDQELEDMDAVLDTVGGETLERSWSVLRKGGALVTIVDDVSEARASEQGVRAVSMLVQPSREQLVEISLLIDGGKITPAVRGVFPLSEAKAAYAKGLAGHNMGKSVLKIG